MLGNQTGELRIWTKKAKTKEGKEFTSFSASIFKKDKEGKNINAYFPVFFNKDIKLPDSESFDVLLTEAWLTPNKRSEDKYYSIALFINKGKILS